MMDLEVSIHVLAGNEDLPLPAYQSAAASGVDLRAAVRTPVVLEPGRITLVPTGMAVAIPMGYEGQVRARSGLALRHGIGVANGPGTIDADYRGEVAVILVNFGREAFEIRRGERIAQLVITPVVQARFVSVSQLPPTARGAGGFGSTGRQ